MSSLEEVPAKATLFSKLYKKNKPTKVEVAKQEAKNAPIIDSTSKDQEQDSILSPNDESLDMEVNDDAKPANDEISAKPSQPSNEEIKDQNPTDNKQIDFDHTSHHYSVDNPSGI